MGFDYNECQTLSKLTCKVERLESMNMVFALACGRDQILVPSYAGGKRITHFSAEGHSNRFNIPCLFM